MSLTEMRLCSVTLGESLSSPRKRRQSSLWVEVPNQAQHAKLLQKQKGSSLLLCFLKPERSVLEDLTENGDRRTRKRAVSCPCLKHLRASPAPAPESGVHAPLP